MKSKPVLLFTIFCIIVGAAAAAWSAAADKKGAVALEIKSSKGDVVFPHRQHQENLKDCKICHQVFPQKAGSIAALISEGKLKKKQVMNKLCLSCHRARKKAGGAYGPTSCKGCHS